MLKTIIFILSLSLSVQLSFAKNIDYTNMSGIEMQMNEKLYSKFKYDYKSYFEKLKGCLKHRFNYINPSHGAKGFFETKGVKRKQCLIVINLNSSSIYKCMLKKNDIKKWISLRTNYLDEITYVETFSREENKIFNNKNCIIEHKTNRQISNSELEKIIKKNPNIETMIKGFGGIKNNNNNK